MVSFTSIEPLTPITLATAGQGEISNKSRPLKPGEVGEWILLDAVCPTPRISHPFLDYTALDACDMCQYFTAQSLPW
jgi:hypothetical protein